MLKRLTERAWYLPWEEETDRPNLCYLLGERHSLAVDAGNSPAHVGKLYRALEEQGLPLPDFTVLTHWHWDHTFGLGAIHGVGIASTKTNEKLRQVAAWQWTPQAMEERERRGEDIPFCNEHIRREYPRLGEIAVSPAAVELEGSLTLDLGGVRCQLLCQENPPRPRRAAGLRAPGGAGGAGGRRLRRLLPSGRRLCPRPHPGFAAAALRLGLPVGAAGPQRAGIQRGGAGVPGSPGGFWAACTKGERCGGNSRGCLLNFLQERKRRGRARGDVLY